MLWLQSFSQSWSGVIPYTVSMPWLIWLEGLLGSGSVQWVIRKIHNQLSDPDPSSLLVGLLALVLKPVLSWTKELPTLCAAFLLMMTQMITPGLNVIVRDIANKKRKWEASIIRNVNATGAGCSCSPIVLPMCVLVVLCSSVTHLLTGAIISNPVLILSKALSFGTYAF